MFTDHTLIIINVTCIVFLLIMMVVLIAATKFKNGAGWAALIIVTTTVPIYMANLTRDLASDHFMMFWYPSVLLNAMCIPSLWFFTRSQLDKSFRLTARSLLHAIPPLVSLLTMIIYYAPLSPEQIEAERAFMEAGGENLPALVNDVIVFGQFLIYSPILFFYIRKRKKYLRDNYSDSGYTEIRWIPRFMYAFFTLFAIVLIAYVINPRTDTWLIPILNIIGMAYLVYIVIFHSTRAYINRLPDIPQEKDRSLTKEPPMSAEEMKEICDRVIDYLKSSQAYLQQDLSLAMLVKETGIPQKTLSRSINGYLKRNFFDLVNEMRVEEAKRRLLELKTDGYKIDSIYEECGFRTRSTFFIAFKKVEGETPAHWLKMNNS